MALDFRKKVWQYSSEMIDLHTHSLLSDGALLPVELVQRAKAKGYQALAITDHCDQSNLEFVIGSLKRFIQTLPKDPEISVIFGVELTHLYPAQIAGMAKKARKLGAEIVVVHGETLVEPVPEGTNEAGIKAGADILAHPGLIKSELVELAGKKGVHLEITTRKGHCYTNGWVAAQARKFGARLVLNTDSHLPDDLTGWEDAKRIGQGAGLSLAEIEEMRMNSWELFKKILKKRNCD